LQNLRDSATLTLWSTRWPVMSLAGVW